MNPSCSYSLPLHPVIFSGVRRGFKCYLQECTNKMAAGEEVGETLVTLQNRLIELEDQLLQLNAVGQPEGTGASTSFTQVSVPREKRFGR